MAAPYGRRVLLLALLLTCDRAWGALAGPAPEQGALEVLIRVQVFDSSDLSPLDNAAVQVFGNQSTLVSSGADGDGLLTVTFRYQLGTSVIVAASKMGYVSNSVPWRANRIPLYSSVSLYLLPQRPATLILYDDVVQLLSGSPGARHQPRVQLQRKAVHLPSDSSYSELWAVLTAARSQYEIGAFPYMLGRDTNGTGGNGSWTDMSPVAAVSAHLVAHNGSAVRVTEPVHVSVPLPSDSPVKAATSVPVWRFDDATGNLNTNRSGEMQMSVAAWVDEEKWVKESMSREAAREVLCSAPGRVSEEEGSDAELIVVSFFVEMGVGEEAIAGLWLRSGTGYIRQEGTLFICSFVAQQLGDWAAALPSGSGVSLGTSGLRDISSYHTIFLLTILGSMALLVLILLCLLLYYCRRRCLKPRQHRKMHVPSTMDSSRRDQGTSMSRLNLISGGHADTASSKDDKNALKCDLSSSQEFFGRDAAHKLQHSKGSGDGRPWRGESFPMKVTRSTEMGADPPLLPSDYARSCGSVEDKSGDGRRRHNANENQGYSSDPPSSPPSAKRSQNPKPDGKPPEYSDPVARPTSLNTQPSQFIFCSSIDQMKENMYRSMVPTLVIPAHYMRLSSDFSGADPAAEPQHKADKDEVPGGRLSTPQPQQQPPTVSPPGEDPEGRGWAPNPSSGPVRIPVLFDNSTMAQMNGELQALTEKKLRELGVRQHPRAWFISLDGRSNSHVRHSYVDLGEEFGLDSMADVRKGKPASQRRAKGDKGGGGGKGHGGKAYAKLSYLEDMESGGGGEGPATMCSPEDNSLTPLLDEEPEPRGASATRRGRSRVSSGNRRDSATSLEDENEADDKDDEGENKKSPWQRREERPLMVFNVKK